MPVPATTGRILAGVVLGVFNPEIHATTVIVIADTTLLTPFRLRLCYRVFGRFFDG